MAADWTSLPDMPSGYPSSFDGGPAEAACDTISFTSACTLTDVRVFMAEARPDLRLGLIQPSKGRVVYRHRPETVRQEIAQQVLDAYVRVWHLAFLEGTSMVVVKVLEDPLEHAATRLAQFVTNGQPRD